MSTLFELTTDMQALYALATEEDDEQAFLEEQGRHITIK